MKKIYYFIAACYLVALESIEDFLRKNREVAEEYFTKKK